MCNKKENFLNKKLNKSRKKRKNFAKKSTITPPLEKKHVRKKITNK